MARQGYYTEPWKKHLEIFQDFSGGMNTVTSHDNMSDREMTDIINMDLGMRGALKRRSGLVPVKETVILTGKTQGYFRHYRTYDTFDTIIAKDGQLELNGVLVPEVEFQKERTVEAVQYYDKTYIATGTKLLVYDGTDVKPIDPYKPEPLEALYVGTNSIAPDPFKYLSDGEGSTLQISGVIFSDRYGVMNVPFTLTAYTISVAGTELEFQFEYRYPFMADGEWVMGQDWSEKKEWTHTAEGEGSMQFRVNARTKGETTVATAQYLVPDYRIKPMPDPDDKIPDYTGIHTCNRILLHWDRIVLYGDTTNFNTVYFSHLKNPRYFPMPHNLRFETEKNEPVRSVTRFRDFLLIFTDSSIQALFGKSPADFRRTVLNTSIGCIAPKSVAVMDNYVVFLSAEGVYFLKSVGYVDDKANVSKLDIPISNQMYLDQDAVAIVSDEHYHIVFPSRKERFRYHKIMQTWVRDKSPHMDLVGIYTMDNDLYVQHENGNLSKFDDNVYADLGHIYEASFQTRYFDFGQPNHSKKLKELQLLASSETEGQVATVSVALDGVKKMESAITWIANLNLTEDYNTFLDKLKVSGKCLRARVTVSHAANNYASFLGIAFILKVKKP